MLFSLTIHLLFFLSLQGEENFYSKILPLVKDISIQEKSGNVITKPLMVEPIIIYKEDSYNCGSGGCGFSLSDTDGRVMYEGLALGKPGIVTTSTNGYYDVVYEVSDYRTGTKSTVTKKVCHTTVGSSYTEEACSSSL
jgi:hypothetical protein